MISRNRKQLTFYSSTFVTQLMTSRCGCFTKARSLPVEKGASSVDLCKCLGHHYSAKLFLPYFLIGPSQLFCREGTQASPLCSLTAGPSPVASWPKHLPSSSLGPDLIAQLTLTPAPSAGTAIICHSLPHNLVWFIHLFWDWLWTYDFPLALASWVLGYRMCHIPYFFSR